MVRENTFISSLIGSNTLDSGKIETVKEIGYVPQKAFVMSGTILDNILMGRGKNNDYLDQAIENSAFRTDLKLMSGLKTEVDERGTIIRWAATTISNCKSYMVIQSC